MKRILFVDDEPLLLEVIEVGLSERAESWEMDFAEGGDRALELMGRKPYDMVVADMRMPAMDGTELLNEVEHRFPGTIRIIMSGETDWKRSGGLTDTAHRHISKPCNLDELERLIDETLRDFFLETEQGS